MAIAYSVGAIFPSCFPTNTLATGSLTWVIGIYKYQMTKLIHQIFNVLFVSMPVIYIYFEAFVTL